jgi:hypothetical protein
MYAKDGPVYLQDPAAFYSMLRREKGRLYSLNISDLWSAPSAQLHATISDSGVPLEYADLALVFSKNDASGQPDQFSLNLTIDLYEGKQCL